MVKTGQARVSAMTEYERRAAKLERKIAEKWGTGRVGRVARFFAEEPRSTRVWAFAEVGE